MDYKTLEYDFSYLYKGISELGYGISTDAKALNCIKDELNKFFTDFKCSNVTMTYNTDNEFFGVQIIPYFDCPSRCCMIFDLDKDIKFARYTVEFDSKLFEHFTPQQVAALLIHDINKINNRSIILDLVACIDAICVNTGLQLKESSIKKNIPFFMFAIQDTVRKMTSSFEYIPSDICLADDFIRSYGLTLSYEEGMECVSKSRNNLAGQICIPSLTMHWYLTHYNLDRESGQVADIMNEIRDLIQLTGSKSLRRLLNETLNEFGERSNAELNYYSALYEATAKKKTSLVSQIKYSGLKSLEDDVYEYRMRIKNIETENEAIYIIRQINNRMGIISDYLENEELSDIDKERFYKLYDKYDNLREELSKSNVYKRKMYGLFVDYNALQQLSNNDPTLNTYY